MENKTIITTETKPKRKYTKREKPTETTNGKIKTTQFRNHIQIIETIIKNKKINETEIDSVKYFVNFMVDEYNKENQVSKI